MSGTVDFKVSVGEYVHAVRSLFTEPTEFFEKAAAPPDFRLLLLFALPPVLIYAVVQGLVVKNPLLIPLYLIAAYAEIGVWMVALKYVVILFGERRTFNETLFIAVSAANVFAVAWIPVAGAPLAVLGAGALTMLGLMHGFKMHYGAALTAVALPLVVTGIVGGLLSWLLILVSSVLTVF